MGAAEVLLGVLLISTFLALAQGITFELLDAGISSAVNATGEPRDSIDSFKPTDDKVVAWIKVRTDGGATVFFNWYSPDGRQYQASQPYQLEVRPDPTCFGSGICVSLIYTTYVPEVLYVRNTTAAGLFGKWRVEIVYQNSVIKTLFFEIVAPKHKVSLDIEPRVGAIIVDGNSIASDKLPLSLDWDEGSQHTINVQPIVQISANGTSYSFTKWSDGDTANTRTITVKGPLSLTAYYVAKQETTTANPRSQASALDSTSNTTLYLAIGGVFAALVTLILLRARRKGVGTEIYAPKQKQPGERGTRVYGQTRTETGTRVYPEKEKEKGD
jgi:hypothetical protein